MNTVKDQVRQAIVDIERGAVLEAPRQIPIAKDVDVIVAGGSPTGVCAAIAAARNGARVLLLERFGFLGGQMTAGMVCSPHRSLSSVQDKHGEELIFIEMLRRCVAASGTRHTWHDVETNPRIDVFLNPEVAKFVLFEMVEESGIELLLHTWVSDAITADGAIRGLIVENKGGRSALLAKVVVDATGDADVAARAGAPFTLRPVEERWGPGMMSLMCGVDIAKTYDYLKRHPDEFTGNKPLAELEESVNGDYQLSGRVFSGFPELIRKAVANDDFDERDQVGFFCLGRGIVMLSGYPGPNGPRTDCLDPEQLTRSEVIFRKWQWRKANFLRKYVPGFEQASLIATGVYLSVRETRSLLSEHVLNGEDVLASREFEDTVLSVPDATASAFVHMIPDHPTAPDEGRVGDLHVPYRSLLPREVDNLLVAGRPVAYLIASGALVGQVAGTAAAMSAVAGVAPRQLEVASLQRRLREQGCIDAAIAT